MLRYGLLVAICVVFAGCTTLGEKPGAGVKAALNPNPIHEETGRLYLVSRSDVKCRKIRRTGTHFLTWACVSRAQEEAEFKRTQEALQKTMRNQSF